MLSACFQVIDELVSSADILLFYELFDIWYKTKKNTWNKTVAMQILHS